ncbi:MAG: hypothetical protein K0U39_07645 [Alphaproteobacteria bacterium]|nr:hypothetical protein [Alphaproteobacteria bacterium]
MPVKLPVKLTLSLTFLLLALNACSSSGNDVNTANTQAEPLALGPEKITKFTSKTTGLYHNQALLSTESLTNEVIYTESNLTLDVNFTRNTVNMNMTDTRATNNNGDFNETALPFLNINNQKLTYNPNGEKISGNITNIGGSHKDIDIASATGKFSAIFNDDTEQFDGGFTLTDAGNTHRVGFGADRIKVPGDDITTFTSTATGIYTNTLFATAAGLSVDNIATSSVLTFDVNFTRDTVHMNMLSTKATINNAVLNGTALSFLNVIDVSLTYNPNGETISGNLTNKGGNYNNMNIASATGSLSATFNDGKEQFDGGFTLTGAGNMHQVGFGANEIAIPADVTATFGSDATGIYTNIPLANSPLARLAGLTMSNIPTKSKLTFNVNFTSNKVIMNMTDTMAVIEGAYNGESLHSLDIINQELTYNPTDKKIGGNVSNEGGTYYNAINIAPATGLVNATFNNDNTKIDGGFTLKGEDDSHVVVFGNAELIPPVDSIGTFTSETKGYYVNTPLATALGSNDSYVSTKSGLSLEVNFTHNKVTMNMENTMAVIDGDETALSFLDMTSDPLEYNAINKTFSGTVTNAGGTHSNINIAAATGNVNATFNDSTEVFDGGFTLTGSDNYRHIVGFGDVTLSSPTDDIVEFTSTATGLYTNAPLATLAGLSVSSIPTSSDLTFNVNFTRKEATMNMLNTKATINNDTYNGTALDFLNIINAELTYNATTKTLQASNISNQGGSFLGLITLASATGDVEAVLNNTETAFDGMFTLTGTNDTHQIGFGTDAIAPPADVTTTFTSVVSGVFNNIFTGELATTADLTLIVNLTRNDASINIQNTTVTTDGYWDNKSIAMLDMTATPLAYNATTKMIAGDVTNKGGTFDNLTMLNFTAETGSFNAALNDANQYYGGFSLTNADANNPNTNYGYIVNFGEDPNAVKPSVTTIFSGTATGTYTYQNLSSPFNTVSDLTLNVNFTNNKVVMDMENTAITSAGHPLQSSGASFLDISSAELTYNASTKMISGTASNKGSTNINNPSAVGTGDVTATLSNDEAQFTGGFTLTDNFNNQHTVTFGLGKQAVEIPSINNITFTGTASGFYKHALLDFGNVMNTTGDLILDVDFDNNKVLMDMNNTVATSGGLNGSSLEFLDIKKAELTYDGNDGTISGEATNKGGTFTNQWSSSIPIASLTGTVSAAWNADSKQFEGSFRMGVISGNWHYVDFGASNENYVNPLVDDVITFTGMATGVYSNANLATSFSLDATTNLPTEGDLTLDVNFATHAATMNMENTVTTIDGTYNGTALPALDITNAALTYHVANASIQGAVTRPTGTINAVSINEATGFVNASWDNTQQRYNGGFILVGNDDSHQVTFKVADTLDEALPPIDGGGNNNGGGGGTPIIPEPPVDVTAEFSTTATGKFSNQATTAAGISDVNTSSNLTLDVNFTSKAVTMNMANTVATNYSNTALDFLNIENASLTYDETTKQMTGNVTNKGGNFTLSTINENIPAGNGDITATLNQAGTEFTSEQATIGVADHNHIIDAFTATKQ